MIQCLAVIPSVLVDTTKDYVVLSERELHFHTKTFQLILTWDRGIRCGGGTISKVKM